MACSYVAHYVHIVFGTKDRVHSIQEEIQPNLCAYMAGVAKDHGIHAVAIGGLADHSHALIDLGAILGVAIIRQYVVNQKDHHCRMDFEKEFRLLAKKHGFEIGDWSIPLIRQLVPSLTGLGSLLWVSRHFRAGLWIVPSLRDSRQDGSGRRDQPSEKLYLDRSKVQTSAFKSLGQALRDVFGFALRALIWE